MDGLVDHQVVHRSRADGATVTVTGTEPVGRVAVADGAGTLVAEWVPVAGTDTRWKAEVDVPVGGPYDIVTDDGGRLVEDFLVGDLWLLAGQSNMQGIGRLDAGVEPPSPQVHVLDLARRWRLAIEPLHRVFESPDLAHCIYEDPEELAVLREDDLRSGYGAGLGVAFGRAMAEATGVPVGLIATAQGATSLAQWSPDLRDQGGRSLFGSMLLSLEAAGGSIAGMLWYQGESDAFDLAASDYAERLERFAAAVRQELSQPTLPFFHVQIGRVRGEAPPEIHENWMTLREQQRLADVGPGGMTTAVDLGLGDFIHLSTPSLRRLGRRLARLALGGPTITLDAVEVRDEPFEVRLRFGGVTGSLSPREHIAGFSLRRPDGTEPPFLFAADVDPDDPWTVVLRMLGPRDDTLSVWHGYGIDPYCNLVDEADMAVPAFGPIPLAHHA